MTDYRKSAGCDESKTPADQPNNPTGKCSDLPTTTPPVQAEPDDCGKPDDHCHCPARPGSDANCLEKLIEQQTSEITKAEKAKAFKAELEALLAKAKTAGQEYTSDKYEKLLKQWKEQDRKIAELIRKLVCSVQCWHCVVECFICPLLNSLHKAEAWLEGDGKQYTEVHSRYDLRYWHERDLDSKQQMFQRVKSALAAWEKPAQSIEKALTDNAKLIAEIDKVGGTDVNKAVYDVFFKLLPMHLAIAPPASPETTTEIESKYTSLCPCDKGTPDECCGPDTGPQSFRQRLIGPQAYLINPADYFDIICCLVEKRYRPAKDKVAEAEAAVQAVSNEITRLKAQIENSLKPGAFEKEAKAAIPSDYKHCDCGSGDSGSQAAQQRR